MPQSEIWLYRDARGRVPVLDWLRALRWKDRKGYANCVDRISMLREMGCELRRPYADYLCRGIHELRAHSGRSQYRILYFFSGRSVVVLAHALAKEGRVPVADIRRAMDRKLDHEAHPKERTHEERWGDEDD